jgi:HAMP domain-containing protein
MTDVSPVDAPPRSKVRFGLRIKLLVAFAAALTLMFAVLSVFTITYVTDAAQAKIQADIQQTANGTALAVNVPGVVQLLSDLPNYDPENPYPTTNDQYTKFGGELFHVRELVPQARPYLYGVDPSTGDLFWIATWEGRASPGGALEPGTPPPPAGGPNPPPAGGPGPGPSAGPAPAPVTGPTGPTGAQEVGLVGYREPVSASVDSERLARMQDGLEAPIGQSPFTNEDGSWIAAYAPVVGDDGTVVAAVGVDYPLSYLEDVRSGAVRVVVPLLLSGYVGLLLLVLVVSTWLTRPLKRLTVATTRIAEGEYDLDLSEVLKTRFPDEMAVLAESFTTMAEKVRIRERTLTQQVRQLRVEIDAAKREQAVAEITESDYFASIAAKADAMRRRNDDLPADTGGDPPS